MTRRWTGLIALLAVFLLGAGAAALAARSSRVSGHAAQSNHAMRATTGTATASAAAAGKKGTTVKTLEADLTIQPGAFDGSSGKCPKKAPHAVSGYWGTDDATREGDLVVIRSTPIHTSGREWEVALKNTSLTPVTAYVGTVCIK
jgi:hypothetical protein